MYDCNASGALLALRSPLAAHTRLSRYCRLHFFFGPWIGEFKSILSSFLECYRCPLFPCYRAARFLAATAVFATAVPLLPPLLQEIQRIFLLGYHRYLNLKRGFSCNHRYHRYLESGSSCYHCYRRYLKVVLLLPLLPPLPPPPQERFLLLPLLL